MTPPLGCATAPFKREPRPQQSDQGGPDKELPSNTPFRTLLDQQKNRNWTCSTNGPNWASMARDTARAGQESRYRAGKVHMPVRINPEQAPPMGPRETPGTPQAERWYSRYQPANGSDMVSTVVVQSAGLSTGFAAPGRAERSFGNPSAA